MPGWQFVIPRWQFVIPDSIRDPVVRQYWIAGRGPQWQYCLRLCHVHATAALRAAGIEQGRNRTGLPGGDRHRKSGADEERRCAAFYEQENDSLGQVSQPVHAGSAGRNIGHRSSPWDFCAERSDQVAPCHAAKNSFRGRLSREPSYSAPAPIPDRCSCSPLGCCPGHEPGVQALGNARHKAARLATGTGFGYRVSALCGNA